MLYNLLFSNIYFFLNNKYQYNNDFTYLHLGNILGVVGEDATTNIVGILFVSYYFQLTNLVLQLLKTPDDYTNHRTEYTCVNFL